jgi:hypothetical protein
MPTTLTTNAIERSTIGITAAFTDETGAVVAPNSGLSWTLTDVVGNVVNGREDVAISSAASVTIALHGADLQISDSFRDNRRLLTISGTYNSSLGSNLEIVDWVQFEILSSPVVP